MTAAVQESLTPTVRSAGRRAAFWIVAAIVAILVFAVSVVLNRASAEAEYLSTETPAPGGTMALAEVLREQGVDVQQVRTLEAAADAIADPRQTTLVLYDANGYLTEQKLRDAAALAASVVLVDPGFFELEAIAPSVATAGGADDVLEDDCDLPAADAAGSVTGEGGGAYRVIGDGDVAERCFGSGDDTASVLTVEDGDRTVTVFGLPDTLTNDLVDERGNAALALNLLGERERLVWYLPSLEDLDGDAVPTLSELSPPWVTPLIALCFAVAIAAALWRGRRLGPLVIENLPVTVPASETMEGRARLYARSSARLRALDALRIGTVDRLARDVGLPRTAGVDEVAGAAAAVTGRPWGEVRALLIDAAPASDADLVRLSDELLRLERAVHAATRPDQWRQGNDR